MRILTVSILMALLSIAGAQAEQVMRDLGLDTTKTTIPLEEVLRGGPPPQGIPALGFAGLQDVAGPTPTPRFVSQEDASGWLKPMEPLIAVTVNSETKGYPLQVLTWHEIANDEIGGVPVAVTFCPLCNSALAFDRRVPASGSGQVTVTFGVSGLLYLSNLLMFDDRTGTLWSQLTGEGVVGENAGFELERYPAQILSFGEFREAFPEASVLSRDTGFDRTYGSNPYVGYDDADSPPFLFQGEVDGRLPPKARVVTLDSRPPVAYPFEVLQTERIVHDSVAGMEIVIFWTPGTASALDQRQIAASADVGAVGVFERRLGDRNLTFTPKGSSFVDEETGTEWSIAGRGISGPLAGEQLTPVVHDNTLWFAWAAFRPETRIHGSVDEQ